MYSMAPRCSDAWSPRSLPACCRLPPPAARADPDSSRPARKTTILLVMRGHPFRHRLGLVDLGPQGHRDEEGEIQEGQHTADDGLHRVGARTGADLAEPDEA